MNDALKAYLTKGEPVELDPALMQEHIRVMTEEVIPAIVQDLREAERVAAELRYSPGTTHHRGANAGAAPDATGRKRP